MMATDALSVPNIQCILCYDYDVVIEKLSEENKTEELAQKYLNKIEDRILEVPPIEREHLENLLRGEIFQNSQIDICKYLKQEDIEIILEDNTISDNRRIFFQYIEAIKKNLSILERTPEIEEMLSFLLRIEKLKLSNYTLWNLLSVFNDKLALKRIDSIFKHETTEETIKTVLEENQIYIESNENVKELVQKLLLAREKLFSEYRKFNYYEIRECKFTIDEIEKHTKQFVESEGKTPNSEELYEVLQRFNFLKERSPEILGLKDKFFEIVRKLIFNPESSSDERFASFFNEQQHYKFSLGFENFCLLIQNYRLSLQLESTEYIREIARRDLSEIYDPRIIGDLMLLHGEYQNTIKEPIIKDKIQDHWLYDLKLRELSERAFYEYLRAILSLWKNYLGNLGFMIQFMDKYPEMSLQIIQVFEIGSNNRTQMSLISYYTLVDKNNIRKGRIDDLEIYTKGNFEYLNKLGTDLKKALYEAIKKLIPQELFELLNNRVLKSGELPFHEKLYDDSSGVWSTTPWNKGIMFCLFYEEELKQRQSLETID